MIKIIVAFGVIGLLYLLCVIANKLIDDIDEHEDITESNMQD